jgi:outer membrane protein
MKKVLIAILALLLSSVDLNAQSEGFSKGDIFISGAFRLASATEGDIENSRFEISPKAGYFITENIALGGRLSYLQNESDNGNGNSAENKSYGLGAFGRYYFTPDKKFSLFGQAGLDYFRSEISSSDFETNGFNLGLGAGLNYFVSKRFSLEASLAFFDYITSSSSAEGTDTRNIVNLGIDFSAITIGLNYKL